MKLIQQLTIKTTHSMAFGMAFKLATCPKHTMLSCALDGKYGRRSADSESLEKIMKI